MSADSVATIDAQLFRARWRFWHATWDVNLELVEVAMASIDDLLDRRFALIQPVDVVAISTPTETPSIATVPVPTAA